METPVRLHIAAGRRVGTSIVPYGVPAYGRIGYGIGENPGTRQLEAVFFSEIDDLVTPIVMLPYGMAPYGGAIVRQAKRPGPVAHWRFDLDGAWAPTFVEDPELEIEMRMFDHGELHVPEMVET